MTDLEKTAEKYRDAGYSDRNAEYYRKFTGCLTVAKKWF